MKYCIQCGKELPDDAVFCIFCGARQLSAAPAAQPSSPSASPAPVRNARQETSYPQANTAGARQPARGKKRFGRFFKRFIALVLIAALVYTGFFDPAFIRNWIAEKYGITSSTGVVEDPDAELTVVRDARGLSKKAPSLPDTLGNSKAYSGSPLAGFTVSAPKNTFAKDTEIRISPVTSVPAPAIEAAGKIEEEGYFLIGGHEFSAGLDDGEFAPGEYTVTVDLSILGIDPSLYDYVCLFRVGEDGSYYRYAVSTENGILTFSSDQNSFLFWAISAAVIGTVYKKLSDVEGEKPFQYFYNTKKKMFSFKGNNGYIDFTVTWAMSDIGIDADPLISRCEEITRSYMAKKDELYSKYQEERQFDATNILNIFDQGKTCAQVLWDAIRADKEYQQLQEKLTVPEPVEYTVECIRRACRFLKGHEYVRMPTGNVDFVSVTTLDSTVLAEMTSRNYHEGYVEINMRQLLNANQTAKNDYLITITHELLHVCQQKYRYFWADSNRYDEMAAVYMEPRALSWFVGESIIAEDEQPTLSSVNYWTTLKLPIDTYYEGQNGSVMKHEGYNLGSFVEYLVKKTGALMYTDRLMYARRSWKQPGVSGALMYAFGIPEAELDVHYRNWIRINREALATHYDSKEPERYKRNEEIAISKGGKYHVDVRPEGPYSSEIRGFQQQTAEKMTLLLIPDNGFSADQPQCDLLPIDSYEKFSKGAIIGPKGTMNNPNRDILEIHGAFGKSSAEKSTGYTIYVLDKTKLPILSEDEEYFILKMPENSYVADDGIVNGYVLTIETEDGLNYEKEIGPEHFEKTIRIEKEELYGKRPLQEALTVTVTLCEFINKSANEKYLCEVSDTAEYTLGSVIPRNLERFTGCWVPVSVTEPDGDDFVIGLAYLEPDDQYPEGEFGYFESQLQYWNAKGRWYEMTEFDYDDSTGELTIEFERGYATFWIDERDHLHMSNYGGSWEFYRADG